MKQKKNLWSDVSILVVAVLAISAFLRGAWQFWMLITAFAVWSAWAVYRHLIPFLKELKYSREAKKVQEQYKKRVEQQKAFLNIDVSDPLSIVLLRHVNHRISAYLKASYPDATWDWCEKDPERLVAKGGTGRIKLNGVPDFNYAEISLDQNAKIDCQLLKIVPYASSKNEVAGSNSEAKPKTPSEVNPQVWFEKQGRAVLQNIIADIDSRGHNSLTIQEDGSIVIKQDNQDFKRHVFTGFPEKTYWSRLVKVFEQNGLASEITDSGLVLSW